MTDNEIKREVTFEERAEYFKKRYNELWEEYENPNGNEDPLYICVLRDGLRAVKKAEETINRQQAEIEEITYKLECLLCQATGSKLSKSTYSLKTMETALNDYINECCGEAKDEAIKEFEKRFENELDKIDNFYFEEEHENFISANKVIALLVNLVKETVGEE